jgi:elongation factor P
MKTNANSLRIGNIIEYQNQLWKILKKDHVKPGKGGAYVQLEMKEISNGTKTNTRLSSSDDVEVAFTEQKKFQFQYFDQDDIMAMSLEDYETHNFNKSLAGEAAKFLDEEMEVTVEFCNDKPISIALPENITVKVAMADGVVKGQTASSSFKPAELENGVKVLVPPFTQSGDEIVIKSETGEYVSKAKK